MKAFSFSWCTSSFFAFIAPFIFCCSFSWAASSAGDVVISEFMASNATTLEDADDDSEDWIELRNRGAETVFLENWTLTDDPSLQDRWHFPAVTLEAGGYLVVFASGKNRTPTDGGELHTHFELDRGGEYLALCDPAGAIACEYAPEYPPQRRDYSYGLNHSGTMTYFLKATPWEENSTQTASGLVDAPSFSPDRGVYDGQMQVELQTMTPDAVILYRMDPECRPLTEANGTEYTGAPLAVAGTTGHAVVNVRAMAVRPGWIPSEVVAASYIFPDFVLRQPKNPDGGFPSTWRNPSSTIGADYELDPDIVNNASYRAMAEDALRNVPSLMISMDIDDLFGSGGLYVNANRDCYAGSGADCQWERACSVEMVYPDGYKGIQVNCGIRMQGQTSRHSVWKVPKLSFRLAFRDDYGPTKLRFPLFPDSHVREFETLVLDAKMNMTWIHPDRSQTDHAQYVREIVCDDWMNLMGSYGCHNIFVNLYVNGLHWGLYDVHERADHDFAASYLGGNGDDYDCLKHWLTNVINPDPPDQSRAINAWNEMYNIVRGSVTDAEFLEVQDYLYMTDFCDYILMNMYAGNSDWAHKNWYCNRNIYDGRWIYHSWDAEHVLKIHEVNRNILDIRSDTGSPALIFTPLRTNAEFRLFFADRVHKHFFNGGVFYVNPDARQWDPEHPENNKPVEHYMKRIEEIDKVIVLESARWGDYRKSIPYTRDDIYTELNGLLNTYFPNRSRYVLNQLKNYGLYPRIDAPEFSRQGGVVASGFQLTMTIPEGTEGTIYYTVDGSDPRTFGTGDVASTAAAYAGAVPINGKVTVKARVKDDDDWSALNEAFFKVSEALDSLAITEVMYHPVGDPDVDGEFFEFVEFKNIGTETIDLAGVFFTGGVEFTFPEGIVLDGGGYLLVVSNRDAFMQRYPGVAEDKIAGQYRGLLGNDYDTVSLYSPDGYELVSFTYGDSGWWPAEADGLGRSLVPKNPGMGEDLGLPGSWTASSNPLGSPGADDGASIPTAPRFLQHPLDVTAIENSKAVFAVDVYAFPSPSFTWKKNGTVIPGATGTSYETPTLTLEMNGDTYQCVVENSEGVSESREAVLTVLPDTTPFTRGDVNADGMIDLSDPIRILLLLFSNQTALPCADAADINDDGDLNIADAVSMLCYLFAGGEQPPVPFEVCGPDITYQDPLDCSSFVPCE